MKQEWFIRVMGDELGPYSFDELEEMTQRGAVAGDTLIRKGDGGPWITASEIDALPAVRRPKLTTLREPTDTSVVPEPTKAPVLKKPREVTRPTASGVQHGMDEVFFDESGVRVTRTRFIVDGQTYSLASITSIRLAVEPLPGELPIGCVVIVIGGVGLVVSATIFVAAASNGRFQDYLIAGLIGLASLAVTIYGFRLPTEVPVRNLYSVCITTAAGEQTVCRSQQEHFVRGIFGALNDAIVARG
jgi:hypothetical protein